MMFMTSVGRKSHSKHATYRKKKNIILLTSRAGEDVGSSDGGAVHVAISLETDVGGASLHRHDVAHAATLLVEVHVHIAL